MKNSTFKEKIYQMFILGLQGENLEENPLLKKAVENNLGGVIFFTQNIITAPSFKKLTDSLNEIAKTPLFLCVDQEGGRVERTLNLHKGQKYLCARETSKKGEDFIKSQSEEIALELKSLGLNMNFAPVLDVDTNPQNPVIAERSYSENPDEVSKCAKIAAREFLGNGIIPVGKHFPGHGDTSADSHTDMPVVEMSLEELEKIHIKPFKELTDVLPAIMAAHVHYKAFDSQEIPASLSSNVLGYLRNELGFDGLIISDDMEMGGVKSFSPLEACIKGIEAGVNMFIFRNSDDNTIKLIDALVEKAEKGELDISKIDYSNKKIEEAKFRLSLF